jgi:CRP-like cAMP-binding protein
MESTDGVLRGYPNVVLIDNTTERGIEYGLHFWVDHAVKRYLIERQVVVNAIEFLNQAGLVPAYPKFDISVARATLRHIERSTDVQDLLERIDLLQAMPTAAIEDLAGRVRSREFQAGSTIVAQGDEGGSLFALVSGLADVYVDGADSGDERRIASLHPGQVFGEMSLLTGARRSATVRAATTVIAVEVSKADLQPIMEENPQLVDRLGEMQSTRLSKNAEELTLSAQERAELSESGIRRLLQKRIRQFFNLSDRPHDAT